MDFYELECRRGKAAVEGFVKSAIAGDLDGMCKCFNDLDGYRFAKGGWARAMREIAKHKKVPRKTQVFFEHVWYRRGDHIRQECGDDFALAVGLRKLLKPYRGPSMTLYRGETFYNRRTRMYGLP